MANVNNPHGLMPLGVSIGGGAPFIQRFAKLAAYATGIFINDPVARVSGGALQIPATPGTTLYSGVSIDYSPASTASIGTGIAVITDPEAMYEGQADSATLANMGLNANLVSGAGSTLTKQSGWYIGVTATPAATTATLDVHLLDFYALVGNANVSGAYVRIEVVFNKSRMGQGVAGV
jgi:hypothetical protein